MQDFRTHRTLVYITLDLRAKSPRLSFYERVIKRKKKDHKQALLDMLSEVMLGKHPSTFHIDKVSKAAVEYRAPEQIIVSGTGNVESLKSWLEENKYQCEVKYVPI